MVRSCLVCKKKDYLNPEVVFRRFPIQTDKRIMWLGMFDMDDDEHVPKTPDICSDHFDPSDVITRPNGSRKIKLEALPRSNASGFLEPLTFG